MYIFQEIYTFPVLTHSLALQKSRLTTVVFSKFLSRHLEFFDGTL